MYPKINQNIVIDIKEKGESCRSVIAEIGDKEILIAYPMDGSNVLGLIPDDVQIDIVYLVGENQFTFQTKILGLRTDKVPLYRIKKPLEKEIIKIQRRDNVRVGANLNIIVSEQELTTVNISAGGLLFSCKREFRSPIGGIVSGILFVPNAVNKELEPVTFQGKIRRTILVQDTELKHVAIEFTQIDQQDQAKIIRYSFEKQRQMLMLKRQGR